MKKRNSDESRRKILKSIAAGSGAIVAGKTLPENWARPVVDSVILPSHAQTSCPGLVNSVPSSLTVQSLVGAPGIDPDGIEILFDGCTSLTMSGLDDPSGSQDRITFIDSDSSLVSANNFDVEDGPGTNWNMISNSFGGPIPISNVADGSHVIRATRLTGSNAGTTYDILFDVAVPALVPPTDGNEMTFTNVRAVIVP